MGDTAARLELTKTWNAGSTGLGAQLMRYLVEAADNIPSVDKVMLTCFTRNTGALRFYERLGFARDESSPADRRLRGGKVVRPDYVILSRRTGR